MRLIEEWMTQNIYHTTSCDEQRRVLGKECVCGKDNCISEAKALEEENKRLKDIIIEAKICAAALCIAELPSFKGLKEIASILNKGIDEGDIKQALK